MSNWVIIGVIAAAIAIYFIRRKPKPQPSGGEGDELFARADALLRETDAMMESSDDLLRQLSNLSEEEEQWMSWFMSLTEPQKQLVEQLGEKGFKVSPKNADDVFSRARDRGLDV